MSQIAELVKLNPNLVKHLLKSHKSENFESIIIGLANMINADNFSMAEIVNNVDTHILNQEKTSLKLGLEYCDELMALVDKITCIDYQHEELDYLVSIIYTVQVDGNLIKLSYSGDNSYYSCNWTISFNDKTVEVTNKTKYKLLIDDIKKHFNVDHVSFETMSAFIFEILQCYDDIAEHYRT